MTKIFPTFSRYIEPGAFKGLARTTTGDSDNTKKSTDTAPNITPSTIGALGQFRFLETPDEQMARHPLEIPSNVEIKIGDIYEFTLSNEEKIKLHFGLYEYEGDSGKNEKDAAVWVVSAFEKLSADSIKENHANLIKQLAEHVNSWGIIRKEEKANPDENNATDPRLRVWIAQSPDDLLQGAGRIARPYPDLTPPEKPVDKFDSFVRNTLCKMHQALDNLRIHADTIWTITQNIYWEQEEAIRKTKIPLHERVTMRELLGDITTDKTIINPATGAEVNAKDYILRRIAHETGFSKRDGTPAHTQWLLNAVESFAIPFKKNLLDDFGYISDNLIANVKIEDKLRKDESTNNERKLNGPEFNLAMERIDKVFTALVDHFGFRFDEEGNMFRIPIDPRTTPKDIEDDHEFEYNFLISDEGELREPTTNKRLIDLGKSTNGGFAVIIDLMNSDFGFRFCDPKDRKDIPLFLYQYRRQTPYRRTMFYMPQRNIDDSIRSSYFSKPKST
ncbi:MAG: hypothetical protein HYR97_04465 [Candidatus Melainabacteria bacterium]|nr:hypothetical protein [Candidatus Melainabacteria bacterium]MBI3309025.1 hypothetical protein [Candidatus Melainabacteria bacterium]